MTKLLLIDKRIPRLWSLVGFPDTGKTDFSIQLRSPIMVVDADHRYSEVLAQRPDAKVYTLTTKPEDLHDARKIATLLDEHMPESGVKTIVVDSVSSIIEPIVTATMLANMAGENVNRATAWSNKAFQMRLLQDCVTKWGVDVLWIYHEVKGRDSQGKESVRMTLPEIERNRLARSLNVNLKTVLHNGRHGIQVVHSRRGNAGFTLWDKVGHWVGMPERLEEAIYDATPKPDAPPERFATPKQAAAWATGKGAYKTEQEATDAYETLKANDAPGTSKEMRDLWVSYVNRIVELREQD